MKITKEQLKTIIREAVENHLMTEKKNDSTEVADAEAIVQFEKRFDKLFKDFIVNGKNLIDDAEKMIRTNGLETAESGTRNERILTKVGILKTTINGMAGTWERLRKLAP